jgi:hypothetical protein
MKFAQFIFFGAGIYGFLSLVPMYFLESRVAIDDPPAVTHPEFYYGFIGVALAWQVMFLVIATDPARYRLAMIPAVLEKASFVAAVSVLYSLGRISSSTLPFAAIDAVLGVLFIASFLKCRSTNAA